MKGIKTLLILGLVFAISYSCSAPRPAAAIKRDTVRPLYVPVVNMTKVVDTTIIQSTDYRGELKGYLDKSLKDYKQDNLRLQQILKLFIDSLSKANANMYRLSNDLIMTDFKNSNRLLKDREALLIERENRDRLQRENLLFQVQVKEGEKLTSSFLITGIVINLLMTVGLFLYKRRSMKQLKKLNLIHA